MSRRKALRANPRRLLAALATILVAVGVTVASGAYVHRLDRERRQHLHRRLAHHEQRQGRHRDPHRLGHEAGRRDDGRHRHRRHQEHRHAHGRVHADPQLAHQLDGTNPLAGKLNTTITDCGTDQNCAVTADNTVKYSGLLSAMSSTISLGNWAGAEQHTYKFVVSLDSCAGNDYQGDNAVAGFTWDAA